MLVVLAPGPRPAPPPPAGLGTQTPLGSRLARLNRRLGGLLTEQGPIRLGDLSGSRGFCRDRSPDPGLGRYAPASSPTCRGSAASPA